jgi:Beta barrel domain of bacteriophage endosialidase.
LCLLSKLQFKPGVVRETTSYTNEGGWFDCDKIRFRAGLPEKIGGWIKKSGSSFLGAARTLHPWVALDGSSYISVGTDSKYYIEEGGAYNDITPIRETTSAGDVTFAATSGSSTITVTDNSHGAIAGDFVTFSGASSLGGQITADVLKSGISDS